MAQSSDMLAHSPLQDVTFYNGDELVRALPASAERIIKDLLGAGPDILNWASAYLQASLGLDFAFVGAIAGADFDHVQTLSVCHRGETIDNFSYQLQGTPCNDVMQRSLCCCLAEVAHAYPDDAMLADMGMQSYVGISLVSEGLPIGIAVCLSAEPMDSDAARATAALLSVLRPQLEAELVQFQAIETMKIAVSEPETSESSLRHLINAIARHTRVTTFLSIEDPEAPEPLVPVAVPFDASMPTLGSNLLAALIEHGDERSALILSKQDTEAVFQKHARKAVVPASACVIPLFAKDEPILGHLVMLHDRPLLPELLTNRLFTLLKARLAAELRRERMDREKFRLQQRLADARREESIGTLASGIAHDFNNLTFIMLGQAQLIKYADPEHPHAELADTIVEAAAKATQLCEQLMAYAGRRESVPELLNINDLVEDTKRLNAIVVAGKANLEFEISASSSFIQGEKTEIQQAIMNLVRNASDASSGGKIRVVTESLLLLASDFDNALIGADSQAGRYVAIRVHDEGQGMTAHQVERIIEPFYTTRAEGHGLGLAVIVGCVHSHHAALFIESEPGAGSTFSILFREVDKPVVDTEKVSSEIAVAPCRKILIIDDDDLVRTTLRNMLRARGVEAILADGAASGITEFATHQDSIDAVLVDYEMPGTRGDEVIVALRRLSKDVPIVLMSGNLDRASLKHFPERPDAYLDKPFEVQTLLSVLADKVSLNSD
tara:strand:+ start:115047 stop:117221 length:2175 start_codon:yes stop_codon:yes gene_type:complete